MKIAIWIGLFFILCACNKKDFVLVSGRIENGDSVIAISTKDSIYTFYLDEDNFFSGRIPLKEGTYASLMPYSVDLFLVPGEDVEIYTNGQNMQASLICKGVLGGINTYLKEQEMMTFVNKDDYLLNESEFVRRMQRIINERVQLLEAKNFNKLFTELEKQRICFSIGEKAIFYPIYHKQFTGDSLYRMGLALRNFLISFSLSAEDLFVTKAYRRFVLGYVYFQNGYDRKIDKSYSDELVDYILNNFQDKEIRNFLLSEVIYRYIWENNGLLGAEYILNIFRRECSDLNKLHFINKMAEQWERLQAGKLAPDFSLKTQEGKIVSLSNYRGFYLYLMVWASWCAPCKNELSYLMELEKRYAGRAIRFLTVSIDGLKNEMAWRELLTRKRYGGIHALSEESDGFRSDYMVVSIPRFVLIGKEGQILNPDAPRPSCEMIEIVLDSLLQNNERIMYD